MPTSLQTASQTFFNNSRLLRRLALFEKEVKENPRSFELGTLRAFELEFTAYGAQQLTNLSQALITRDLAGRNIPGIFLSLRDRHIGLWGRAIANAFSTAASSIAGKTRFPGQPTIVQRILNFLLGQKALEESQGFYIDKNGQVFSVRKLINATADEVVIDIKVDSLKWILSRKVWWINSPTAGVFRVSPNEVMEMLRNRTYPEDDLEDHRNRLATADLSFPIILERWGRLPRIFGKGAGVIDGYHRLLAAIKRGRSTIKARVLTGGVPQEAVATNFILPTEAQLRPQLLGIARVATQGKTKRLFRQSLTPTIKMLFRTMPRNLHREHNLLISKLTLGPVAAGDMEVFSINTGHSAQSCTTCLALNGRFLTKDALKFATTRLQPTLFHPNCRHYTLKQIATVQTFKEQKELVTLDVLRALVARGQLKLARRPVNSPVSI